WFCVRELTRPPYAYLLSLHDALPICVNLPVILGVLGFLPYVQDEELPIPETATHKTCCVTTDRAVESQCDLVTGKDRVVIALDEIPFRLAHPARTTFRNLVEKEAAVGRIRCCAVVQDCLGEPVNIGPGSVTISFSKGLLYLFLVPDVRDVDIALKAVVKPISLSHHL